eukprot:scaffold266545_cov13-Tisochrysis_lutea.AAC.1
MPAVTLAQQRHRLPIDDLGIGHTAPVGFAAEALPTSYSLSCARVLPDSNGEPPRAEGHRVQEVPAREMRLGRADVGGRRRRRR